MATSIRFEDRLEGVCNFLQWKVRISVVIKENKLWPCVSAALVPPIDPIALDVYEVREAKAQRIILDGVKDALIPNLAEKIPPLRGGRL